MEVAKSSISRFVSSHPYICGAAALTSLGFAVGVYAFRSFIRGGSRVCTSKARLDGKTVIITGANTGIGKETAIDLARRGARVILACRSVEKGEKATMEVRERSGNENAVFRQLDLSSLASVRQFSAKILEEEPRIDILINNAGRGPAPYSTTDEGYETIFVTNYLGHFLLTCLLLERLKEAPSARIVNVSAEAYKFTQIEFNNLNLERDYNGFKAYAVSKLAQVMFTKELSRRLEGTRITATALHPGGVRTELQRNMWWPLKLAVNVVRFFFLKSAREGAQTTIYCAVSEDMEGVSGQYLCDCRIQRITNSQALDEVACQRLWSVSCQMTGLELSTHC